MGGEPAAARAYYAQTGTLSAPVNATMLDKPVGQWLAYCRKQGDLGKNLQRVARRAAQLAAVHEDWNPGALGWAVHWQRSSPSAGPGSGSLKPRHAASEHSSCPSGPSIVPGQDA